MKVSKNDKGQWFYDVTFDGCRHRVVTGLTRADTERAMYEKLEHLRKEKHGIFENVEPVQKPVLFEDFAEGFLKLLAEKGKIRPNTMASYENSVRVHLVPALKGKSLQDITPEFVERYQAARNAEDPRPSACSVNRELSCLRAICRKALRWKRITDDPTADMEKDPEPKRERILTNEERERLVELASPNLKPILVVALHTGLRKGEVLGLRWENVRFGERLITILAAEAKSKKLRKVPMDSTVVETLRAIPRRGESVFGVKDVKTSFHTACRRAKIKGLRFHDLRHTFATWFYRATRDVVALQKILGHSKIEMTMRYVHETFEDMQAAVEKFEALYAGKNPVIEVKKSEVELPASHRYINN